MAPARRAAATRRQVALPRTAAEESPAVRRGNEPSGPGGRPDASFDRAILKIALELKKPSAPGYDAIVERTIRVMKLDPVAFRRYLGENGARNMSLLLATARGSGL
jgi:hypothetical protein